MDYLVPVRMSKDPLHDPKNKITGACPISQLECTDTTGEHHTFLHRADSAREIQEGMASLGVHVTRIELVGESFFAVRPRN